MDNFKHLCPVCKAKGNTTFLQLRQINLSTAVYLCKDIRCEYPLGHSWIYEDRKLSDSDNDDSDSDLSDIVNNDIENMNLSNTLDLNACNVEKHISNKLITENSTFASSVTTNKHEYDSLKFEDNISTINQNYVPTPRVEVEDIHCSSVVDNVKHISNTLITEHSIFASSVTTNKHDYESFNLKDNISDTIHQNSVRTPCEEVEDMNCSSVLDNVQSEIHNSTFCDVTFIESAQEVENVIIDDPNELFCSLDLPCDTVTTNENYKILATGAENTEIVDVGLSEIIMSRDAKDEYEIVKNQIDANTITIDIKIPNLIQDNKVRESEKETNKINTLVMEKDAKKKFVILNAKTGTYSKLNKVPDNNTNEVNIINLPDDICKKKPNTLQHINSNEVLGITQPNQITNMEVDSKNILLEKKTNKSVTGNSETSNENDTSKNVDTAAVETKIQDENVMLPFVNDANTEFKSVYTSKLKLHAKKTKPKFHFPESAVEDALKTLQGHVSSDIKKKSTVQVISGKSKTRMPKKKTASSFEGFKFSSKVIKQACLNNRHVDSLDQLELKNFLQSTKTKRRNKVKSTYESHSNQNVLNLNMDSSTDTSNSSTASDCNPNDKTNLGIGDLTLNELFDNMDDLSAVNVPNSSADITEVDDWLNSLCE